MKSSLLSMLAVSLVFALSADSLALRMWRPYAEHIAESYAVVVGEVVETEDFDPYQARRVSLLSVSAVLYSAHAISAGDTMRVAWTSSTVQVKGMDGIVWAEDQGPDLESRVGQPAIWLLGCCRDSLPYAKYESRPLGAEHSADLHRSLSELLESTAAPGRSPKVNAVEAYLEGYLAGLAAGWRKTSDEWRSNIL